MTSLPLLFILIPLFLCWGSFLNMLGYRLIHHISLGGRSQCCHCQQTIAWYDLTPVVSWIALKGSCRSCHHRISPLYPFIELITTILFTGMYLAIPSSYWIGYTIFFSALIITIRSDLECMLISRLVTLYLMPVGIIFSIMRLLPISPIESILGAVIGYSSLWIIATTFARYTGKQGMGQGDLDLFCFIGAFTGPLGCWITIMISSFTSLAIGLMYLAITGRSYNVKIPFGPFLALGALSFVFFKTPILHLLFGNIYF